MEPAIIKWLLAQGPPVVILAVVWWFARKDYLKELDRLQGRLEEKDQQLLEYIQGMNAIARAVDKVSERLR